MSEDKIECWNCQCSVQLESTAPIETDVACPDCGEFLFSDGDRPFGPAGLDAESLDSDWQTEDELVDSVFNIHSQRAARRRQRTSRQASPWRGAILGISITSACVLSVGLVVFFLNANPDWPPKKAGPPKTVSTPKTNVNPPITVEPDLSRTQESINQLRQQQFDRLNQKVSEILSNDLGTSEGISSPEFNPPSIEPTRIPLPEMPFHSVANNSQNTQTEIARNKNKSSNVAARFNFADGEKYRVRYEVKAEFESRTEVTSGTCDYEVLGRNKQQAGVAAEREGSGTAFVVAADGVLVTCAHVVEDANEVEVILGEKAYTAKVIDADEATDLAVLKIDAKDLKSLPLADSDAALLGQDVRAVGYPLSDVLGTGVKVTRGTISGIMQRNGQKQMQIDAAVNPGNSGGPVVNSLGEVVGVASAKLNGMEIQRVGICVPANPVREILKKNGTKAQSSESDVELKGPELVAAVTPAVAYVKVKSGPGADSKHSELKFNSSFRKSIVSAQGRMVPSYRYRGSGSAFGRGTLLLTHLGEIVRTSEEEQLPYLIGPPSQLVLLEFRKGRRDQWTTKRQTSLIQERPELTRSGIPLPRYIDPFGNRRNSEVVKVLPAVEIQTYKVKSEDDRVIVIGLEYDFQTNKSDIGQTIRLVGEGEYRFDKVRGMTSKYEFKGTYRVESEQVTLKVPLTVSATLISREEIEAEAARIAKAKAEEAARPAVVNSMGTAPRLRYPVKQQIPEMGWGIKSLAFSPNGKFVAAGKSDDYIEIYGVDSGRKIFTEGRLREMGDISAVTFSPAGKYLLAGGFKGLIKIYEVADNGLLSPAGDFLGHTREISEIAISPDGKHVLSGGAAKQVRYWNLETQEEVFSSEIFEYGKIGIHFIDEQHAFVSDGRTLCKLDLNSGKTVENFELRSSGSANNIFFSPDGDVVAVTDGYSVRQWQTVDGKEIPELKGKETLWDAEFSADGRKIIAGGRGHLVIWDREKQEREGHVLLGDSIMYVKPVVVSKDGKYVTCYPSSAGQSLWIFDFEKEEG